MKLFFFASLFVTTSAFSQQIPVPIPWPGPNCASEEQARALKIKIRSLCEAKLSQIESEKNMVCDLSSQSDLGCWAKCDLTSVDYRTAQVRIDTTWNCSAIEKNRVIKTVVKYKR